MVALLLTLKIAHIALASTWIGAGVTAPFDLRRTLSLGPPHLGQLMPRFRTISRIMNWSALGTLVTGLAMVLTVGGFGHVPHRIHLGLLLTLLAVAAGRWMIRPVLGQIARAIAAPVAPDEAGRIVARFWMVNGVEHALRLAVLILMIYPFSF